MPNDSEDYIGGLLTLGSIVNRGPGLPSPDFTIVDLIVDSASHELDLSSLVPADALAVLMNCIAYSDNAWSMIIASKGDIGTPSGCTIGGPYSAGVSETENPIIFLGSDGIIEYLCSSGITIVSLTVTGWFT